MNLNNINTDTLFFCAQYTMISGIYGTDPQPYREKIDFYDDSIDCGSSYLSSVDIGYVPGMGGVVYIKGTCADGTVVEKGLTDANGIQYYKHSGAKGINSLLAHSSSDDLGVYAVSFNPSENKLPANVPISSEDFKKHEFTCPGKSKINELSLQMAKKEKAPLTIQAKCSGSSKTLMIILILVFVFIVLAAIIVAVVLARKHKKSK